jgi:hypothetical protein
MMTTAIRTFMTFTQLATASLLVAACGGGSGDTAAAVPQSVSADWNAVALQAWTQLEATAQAPITPHYEARSLAMASAAIHDVLNAIDRRYQPYAYDAVQRDASPDAAMAQAAHDVLVADSQLVSDFPLGSQQGFLDAALVSDLAKVPEGPAKASGIALGKAAAAYYVQLRSADAAHMAPFGPNPKGQGTVAGAYQYTVPFNSPGAPFFGGSIAVPDWLNITPFVLKTTSQFAVPGPNSATSPEFAADLAEVTSLGAATGSTRTADQTELATFFSENSPLQWNRVAHTVAASKGLNGWDEARLHALLNLSLADAYIVYAAVGEQYNFWRPVTAIHFNNPTSTWQEFGFPTPPTRDYTSGHSMQGGAAAAVLKSVFGADTATFSATSTADPGVTRSFSSFSEAADANALSRIYIGYHFRKSIDDGKALGSKIGQYVASQALAKAP